MHLNVKIRKKWSKQIIQSAYDFFFNCSLAETVTKLFYLMFIKLWQHCCLSFDSFLYVFFFVLENMKLRLVDLDFFYKLILCLNCHNFFKSRKPLLYNVMKVPLSNKTNILSSIRDYIVDLWFLIDL